MKRDVMLTVATRMRDAMLTDAIAWIAENDDAVELDASVIEHYLSVALVADLFGTTTEEIARRVAAIRNCGGAK